MWFFTALQNPPAVIVTLVDKPTPQTDYGDVIIASLGLAIGPLLPVRRRW